MSEFNLKQQTTPIAISLDPGLFGLPCRDVMWRILAPGHSARIAERRPSAFRAIHQCGAVCNVQLVVSLESCEARGVVEVVIDILGRAASMTLAIAILVPSSSDPGPRVYSDTDAGAGEEFYCFLGSEAGLPAPLKGSLRHSSAHDLP